MSEAQAHSETITPHAHSPAGEHAPHQLPFTEAEWQALQASDLAASRAVVTLLLSVFCIGVLIYSIVVYYVS